MTEDGTVFEKKWQKKRIGKVVKEGKYELSNYTKLIENIRQKLEEPSQASKFSSIGQFEIKDAKGATFSMYLDGSGPIVKEAKIKNIKISFNVSRMKYVNNEYNVNILLDGVDFESSDSVNYQYKTQALYALKYILLYLIAADKPNYITMKELDHYKQTFMTDESVFTGSRARSGFDFGLVSWE